MECFDVERPTEQLFVVIHAWNLNCLATGMLLWNMKQVTIVIKNYWNTVVTVHFNASLLDAKFHNWQIFDRERERETERVFLSYHLQMTNIKRFMNILTKAIKDQEDTIQIKIERKFISASLTRITGPIMLTNEWKKRSLLEGLYQFTLHRKFVPKIICRKWHASSKCSLVFLLIFDHLKCKKQWSNKGVFFLLSICLSKQENDRRSQLKKGSVKNSVFLHTYRTNPNWRHIEPWTNELSLLFVLHLKCVWSY